MIFLCYSFIPCFYTTDKVFLRKKSFLQLFFLIVSKSIILLTKNFYFSKGTHFCFQTQETFLFEIQKFKSISLDYTILLYKLGFCCNKSEPFFTGLTQVLLFLFSKSFQFVTSCTIVLTNLNLFTSSLCFQGLIRRLESLHKTTLIFMALNIKITKTQQN